MTSALSQVAGLVVEQHDDGYLIFRLNDVTRATIDAVYDTFRRYDREAHESGQSRRTLVDMRRAGWPKSRHGAKTRLRAAYRRRARAIS
jgi:hypothetical protein